MITRYTDGQSQTQDLQGMPDYEVKIPSVADLAEDKQSDENARIAESIKKLWDKETARCEVYLDRARDAWDMYHQTWDNSEDKDEWQCKGKFPIFLSQVERFTSLLMRMLDASPNWFEIEALIPQHQVFMDIAKNFLKFLLEHDSTNFRSKLAEMFRGGLITGQIFAKVVYKKDDIEQYGQDVLLPFDQDQDILGLFQGVKGQSKPFVPNNKIPRPFIDIKNFYDVRIDSTKFGRYVMWQEAIPIGSLIDTGGERGFLLDAIARAAIKMNDMDNSKVVDQAVTQNIQPDAQPCTELLCTFFEGTLPHWENGNLIFKDRLCVVANGEVIYEPRETHWWDGEKALVTGPFVAVPFSAYGKSLLAESLDSFMVENEILALLIDYCQVAVYGAWEQDEERLNPEDLLFDQKMAPGAIFRTTGMNPGGQPATRRIPIQAVGADFGQFWQIFQQTVENITGGSNQLGGASRARGRMTGNEFMARQADSGSLVQNWFEEIERLILSPMFRLLFLRGLQETPDDMWKAWCLSQKESIMQGMTAEKDGDVYQAWDKAITECADMNAEARYKKLGSFMRAKVKIFSSLAERQMQIEQASFLLKQVAQIPGAIQYLRLDVVLTYLVRAIGWDPEKVLNLGLIPKPNVNFPDEATATGFGEFAHSSEGDGDSLDLSGGVFDLLRGNPQEPQPMQPQVGQPTKRNLNASPLPGGPSQPSPNPPKDIWNS